MTSLNVQLKLNFFFFSNLEDIYSFFGNSINRWDLLSTFTGESTITLKRLNPTRRAW